MKNKLKLNVVIAGAGIAGLATALALHKAGHGVAVVERTPLLGTVGAGILIQANGLLVLDALGLVTAVRASGVTRSVFDVRDRHGRILLRTDFGEGLPSSLYPVTIHRAELHRILWETCIGAGVTLHLGHKVISVEMNTQPPVLVCETRSGEKRLSGDLVIAADGVNSSVRATGGFGTHFEPIVEGSVQGVAPFLLPEEYYGEYFSGGEACGMLPISGSQTFWFWGGSGKAVKAIDATSYLDWRERVCKRFPMMQRVLVHQQEWSGLVRLLHRSVRCERWSHDNVVLIGDAAHAMSPNLGQGANCALVDALALACHVEATSLAHGLDEALVQFERERRPLVETLQRRGHHEGILGTQSWPGADLLFRLLLRLVRHAPHARRRAEIRMISGLERNGFDLAAAGIGLSMPWNQ